MQSKWLAAAAAGLAMTVVTSADAQRYGPRPGPGYGWYQGWRIIGFKVVNGGSDTDWIYTPGARLFRQIRVCALDGPITLRDLDVYYADGGHDDINTRDVLLPGTCTRPLDLRGYGRDIERIRLKYGQIDRSLRAPTVRVTAR